VITRNEPLRARQRPCADGTRATEKTATRNEPSANEDFACSPRHRLVARNVFLVAAGVAVPRRAGLYAVPKRPTMRCPTLSDVQVIVYTDYAGRRRSRRNQVTYPLTTAKLAVPRAKVVRASRVRGL